VRRPPEFYAHLLTDEAETRRQLSAKVRDALLAPTPAEAPGLTHTAELSQLPLLIEQREKRHQLFSAGQLDQDVQQADLRETKSWRILVAELPTVELLEVHLFNAVAPFVLNARFDLPMLRTDTRDKLIVNVPAVEGPFYRRARTTWHRRLGLPQRRQPHERRRSGVGDRRRPDRDRGTEARDPRLASPTGDRRRRRAYRRPDYQRHEQRRARLGEFLKDYMPTDW